jgi:hypothetical protein
MKIEIKKETKPDEQIFYWVYVNGTAAYCYTKIEDAEKCYNTIKKNRAESIIETLKSEDL